MVNNISDILNLQTVQNNEHNKHSIYFGLHLGLSLKDFSC